MKRMMALLWALSIPLMVFSAVQPAAAASFHYYFDFNNGSVKPFQPLADEIGNMDSETLTATSNCNVGEGLINSCAKLLNSHGASFVAMMAQLSGHGRVVEVDFIARDLGNCGRCAILGYVGIGKPEGIGSFQKVGPVLAPQWQSYHYQAMLTSSNPVVAVGIMNLDDLNDKQQGGIDNLEVTFLGR